MCMQFCNQMSTENLSVLKDIWYIDILYQSFRVQWSACLVNGDQWIVLHRLIYRLFNMDQ